MWDMAGVREIPLDAHFNVEDRGWAVDVIGAASLSRDLLADLHVVSMRPGTVRGNHYHPDSSEWLLICGGAAKLVWGRTGDEEIEEILVEGMQPHLFRMPPGVRHTIKNLSDRLIYLVVLADAPNRTTVRCASLI
jgi:dTDP-4-dehydrorhamnose 3,5-epimerase-like enzyme